MTMKVSFKRTHKYCCEWCNKQFDWDENSRCYGSYNDIDEGKKIPVFCSEECGDIFRTRTVTTDKQKT